MIMQDNEKKPALRFKGFTDPWEQRKLGDLCVEFRSGEFISASDITETGEYPVFGGNGLRGFTDRFNHDGEYTLIGRQGALCGNVNFAVGKSYFTEHAIAVRADKKNQTRFLYYLFSTMDLGQYSGQSAQPGLAVGNLVELKSTLPDKQEQEKISGVLTALDTLITLHQRKYEKLVNIKKSMLDKMFPQNGASVPEIRFKGFTDPWEQRKVREVTDRYDNLRIPVAASLRVAGTTPYYGANGIQDYVEGYTHDGEFILVAEDGANDLKNYPVKCVKGRIWVNNHAHVLQGKCACADNQFLAYAISQADIESLLVGGGRAKLNAETLMDIELLLPSKDEQIQIGHYLARLDHLITLHQRKLEKLQNIKKSCLEKMFV